MVRSLEGPPPGTGRLEVVERKGLGHPDTICDALAEETSRALLRHYRERARRPLHHNVDKVLLRGGAARPAFGGGEVLEPIEIYLAGRAARIPGDAPLEALAAETCRAWLRAHLHALDAERHVRIHPLFRGGSAELVGLFDAGEAEARANDTSCGVGFWPLTPLEKAVLHVERSLNAPKAAERRPERGEDVKVMGVRVGDRLDVTVACAFVGRFLRDLRDYREKKEELRREAGALVRDLWDGPCEVRVNAADGEDEGGVYLTVTGTSAEAGDDGQVGRGNRVNGLITFHRPMSLEAAAGKNAVSHAGKLYNVAAGRIARAVVDELSGVAAAECRLVSRIGSPVSDPLVADVAVAAEDGTARLEAPIARIVRAQLALVPTMWKDFLSGDVGVF
jgi:S-adenosylmethionine synthetase